MTTTDQTPTLRVVSYGGGVQSTALLVLAAQGVIPHRTFLFANVGDDSEHPDTIRYVEEVARPYAKANDVDLVEVRRRPWPTGSELTLRSMLDAYNGCQACGVDPDDECSPTCPSTNNTGGDMPIPAYVQPSNIPVTRSCTLHWKIEPIDRWLQEAGATSERPAELALGISVDEIERARSGGGAAHVRRTYPLLDLRMNRSDCQFSISRAGLPVPPKSACWFCPFTRNYQWREMRRDQPELFARAVELEDKLNVQRRRRNLSAVHLVTQWRAVERLARCRPVSVRWLE